MGGWEVVKLGEVINKIIGGGTPSKANPDYWNGDIPWCSVKDMSDDRFQIESTEDFITLSGLQNSTSNLIPRGTVITSTRMGLGRAFINKVDMAINQDLKALIPNEKIDNKFLLWTIVSKRTELEALGTGATVKGIRVDTLADVKISLPPLHIQRKIASILSVYDDLIENNLRRIKLMEEMARITYDEWFLRFRVNDKRLKIDNRTELPYGWEIKKLNEIADVNRNQIKKGCEDKIKYVDISSVSPGRIDFFTEYSFEDAPGRARRIVKHGDIIWSCVRPNRRSHCIIWNPDPALIVSTGFAVITPKDVPTSYLYQFLTTDAFVGRLTNLAGGAAYPAITSDAFEDADVVVPSNDILDSFDKTVRPTIDLISNLTKQNALLKEARDILLPRLMTGLIEVDIEQTELKIVPINQGKTRETPWEFKEAILISMLTERFANKQYPLGRKRYTKFSYLFHRHVDNQVQDYLRKAAGPYNPKTKYQGPEKIAHENGYVQDYQNGKLSGFIPGENIAAAKTYFQNYWSIDCLTWLETHFKYKSNDELELYATVDNAMLELHKNNKPINVQEIKTIIKTEKEWKAKLEREIFSDDNIQKAINYLPSIFHYT